MVHALILAGGRGTRAGFDIPKQFIELSGVPLIIRTLREFDGHPAVDSITVAVPPESIRDTREISERYGIGKLAKVVAGGATRQQSSFIAVNSLNCSDDDIVLIHDAARPFAGADLISRVIEAAGREGAAEPAIPVTDTVFAVSPEGKIISVPDRKGLVLSQTPQGFRFRIIMDAHEKGAARGIAADDDISLVVKNGGNAVLVKGSAVNIKITDRMDFIIAEALLKSRADFC